MSKALFYMLNYGAGNRSRTYDLRITNALLYQLSYTGDVGIFCLVCPTDQSLWRALLHEMAAWWCVCFLFEHPPWHEACH